MAGMHTSVLREVCTSVRDGRGWSGLLPGETRGRFSVYRIQFEDGTAYVGMTGGTVVDRVSIHLFSNNGSPKVRAQYIAGVAFRFDVLASGLAGVHASRVELDEIGKLRRPLNVIGARSHDMADLFAGMTWGTSDGDGEMAGGQR